MMKGKEKDLKRRRETGNSKKGMLKFGLRKNRKRPRNHKQIKVITLSIIRAKFKTTQSRTMILAIKGNTASLGTIIQSSRKKKMKRKLFLNNAIQTVTDLIQTSSKCWKEKLLMQVRTSLSTILPNFKKQRTFSRKQSYFL